MWARVVEFMLGCWLAVSPFIFQHREESNLWWVDFGAALLIVLLSLISYWSPMRLAHLAIVLVATALILHGRFAGGEIVPADQNHIIVGVLLLMFAIVPNEATRPPKSWHPQYREPAR